MGATEGVLIAVIVILTLLVMQNTSPSKAKANSGKSKSWTCVNNNSGEVSNVEMKSEGFGSPSLGNRSSYEKMTNECMKENLEYFSVCSGKDETAQVLDCVCGDNPNVNFAKWDYGAPGYSYQDYVSSQGVDSKVLQNHLQFVRDRKGLGPEGELITGRTYSPDSHDSYDPIPWVGIRGRPQYVQQCNPTQVPDTDTNLYKGNRPYCFWT